MFGRNTPNENNPPTLELMVDAAAEARKTNRIHHQNSDRVARPLKSAYLEKPVLIDSTKVIVCSRFPAPE
jgi:hypothetical protein